MKKIILYTFLIIQQNILYCSDKREKLQNPEERKKLTDISRQQKLLKKLEKHYQNGSSNVSHFYKLKKQLTAITRSADNE